MGCLSRPGGGFEESTSLFLLSYKKRRETSPKSQEDRLRQPWRKRKVRPKVGVGEVGLPHSHLRLTASCWRHLLKPCGEPGSLPGQRPELGLRLACQTQGTSGPACGSGSLTPGLSWESRDETGQPGAFSGSNDFSTCPRNKCTTDKTMWSGPEDLL